MTAARNAKVVVGYYGAIARWFDWPMWEFAARSRPAWSFILIGFPYDVKGCEYLERAKSLANVHFLGPKPYHELKRYLACFDVATIPFVLDAITHACSPVKLFEYMAAGKPVVATKMRQVLKTEGVLFAEGNDDFVRRLEEAVRCHQDALYVARLRSEASANSWRSRAQVLLDALREVRHRQNGVPRRHLLAGRAS
jgi:glycosyltransferase involved in cell wall biosynthesis